MRTNHGRSRVAYMYECCFSVTHHTIPYTHTQLCAPAAHIHSYIRMQTCTAERVALAARVVTAGLLACCLPVDSSSAYLLCTREAAHRVPSHSHTLTQIQTHTHTKYTSQTAQRNARRRAPRCREIRRRRRRSEQQRAQTRTGGRNTAARAVGM